MIDLAAYVKYKRTFTLRALRLGMIARDPHCFWCGCFVREYNLPAIKKGTFYPDNMATVEHLFDRFEPEKRYKVYPNHEDKVLACFKCNSARGKLKVKSLPKDYLDMRQRKAEERKELGLNTPRPLYLPVPPVRIEEIK